MRTDSLILMGLDETGTSPVRLRRLRWAVRGTMILGLVASGTANYLDAQPNVISQVIHAWPPCALWLATELISRVPVPRRYLAAVRLTATGTIATIAAWVSYGHMTAVAGRYGETGSAAYLSPLTVDGLIVVASITLVQLGSYGTPTESHRTDLETPNETETVSPSPMGLPLGPSETLAEILGGTETDLETPDETESVPPSPGETDLETSDETESVPPSPSETDLETRRSQRDRGLAILRDGGTPADVIAAGLASKSTAHRWAADLRRETVNV